MPARSPSTRHRGREPLDQPFRRRRRKPAEGDRVAEALSRAQTVREAAKIAVALFGVPRRYVAFYLRLDQTNAVKMMKISRAARWWSDYWERSGRMPKRGSPTTSKVQRFQGPLD